MTDSDELASNYVYISFSNLVSWGRAGGLL